MLHVLNAQLHAQAQRLSVLVLLLVCGVNVSSLAVAQPPIAREALILGPHRQKPVRQVVIHTTGGPDCQAARSFRSGTLNGIVEHFRRNQQRISIHYIIGREGEIVRMVPESRVAFHVRSHNADSIGIELINDGDGHDPFSEAQIQALIELVRDVLARHHLDSTALKSHAELDRRDMICNGRHLKRKVDPGPAFPWARVKAAVRK